MRFTQPTVLLSLLSAWASTAVGLERGDGIRTIPLRTHSLGAPYLDTDMQSRWFDFGGDTIVRADKYIRLASDLPSRTGWIFSKIPLTATNWEIEVEFQVHGKATLHGDGMALWITKQRAQQGSVFGHVDKFEGLGVFIDTYKNNRPGTVFPYVMAMVGDGEASYDKDTDGKDQELDGCSARGLRGATVPTRLRLTYFQDKSLTLALRYKAEDEWTPCFETGPITLPSVSYLGFSAETGELSDNFDIISVETKNLYVVNSASEGGSAGKGKMGKDGKRLLKNNRQTESGGWGWFFVKMILFVIVCGGGYVGYTAYRTSKRHSRFD